MVDEWGAKPAPPNYANLSSSSSRLNVMPPSNGAPKVLVIKAKVKAQPKSSNGKPASSAAWNFKGSSSGPGLRTLSGGVRAAPSPCASIPTTSNNPSFHRSNAAPPTAWANSSAMSDITRSVSGMQVDSAFPGLPTPQRRSNNGSSSASPWAHAASSSGGVALPDEWEIEDSDNTGKRKKKGKKVLMHFG